MSFSLVKEEKSSENNSKKKSENYSGKKSLNRYSPSTKEHLSRQKSFMERIVNKDYFDPDLEF